MHAARVIRTLATMQTMLKPAVSVKSNRFSGSKHIKIKLPGTCTIELAEDGYTISLPDLLIKTPTSPSSEMEFAGAYESQIRQICSCWTINHGYAHLI